MRAVSKHEANPYLNSMINRICNKYVVSFTTQILSSHLEVAGTFSGQRLQRYGAAACACRRLSNIYLDGTDGGHIRLSHIPGCNTQPSRKYIVNK